MSSPAFHLLDEPSDVSVRLLIQNLLSDCENKGVNPKNYAHRSRVIRQQTERLARQVFSLRTGQQPKPRTIFRSAAEEAETKAAHDVMDNEGPTLVGGRSR